MSSLRKALLGLLTVPLTLGVMTAGNQAAAKVTASPVTMTSGFYVDPNSNRLPGSGRTPATPTRHSSGPRSPRRPAAAGSATGVATSPRR